MIDNYKLISEIVSEGAVAKKAAELAGKGFAFGIGSLTAGALSAAGTDVYLKNKKKLRKQAKKVLKKIDKKI